MHGPGLVAVACLYASPGVFHCGVWGSTFAWSPTDTLSSRPHARYLQSEAGPRQQSPRVRPDDTTAHIHRQINTFMCSPLPYALRLLARTEARDDTWHAWWTRQLESQPEWRQFKASVILNVMGSSMACRAEGMCKRTYRDL